MMLIAPEDDREHPFPEHLSPLTDTPLVFDGGDIVAWLLAPREADESYGC